MVKICLSENRLAFSGTIIRNVYSFLVLVAMGLLLMLGSKKKKLRDDVPEMVGYVGYMMGGYPIELFSLGWCLLVASLAPLINLFIFTIGLDFNRWPLGESLSKELKKMMGFSMKPDAEIICNPGQKNSYTMKLFTIEKLLDLSSYLSSPARSYEKLAMSDVEIGTLREREEKEEEYRIEGFEELSGVVNVNVDLNEERRRPKKKEEDKSSKKESNKKIGRKKKKSRESSPSILPKRRRGNPVINASGGTKSFESLDSNRMRKVLDKKSSKTKKPIKNNSGNSQNYNTGYNDESWNRMVVSSLDSSYCSSTLVHCESSEAFTGTKTTKKIEGEPKISLLHKRAKKSQKIENKEPFRSEIQQANKKESSESGYEEFSSRGREFNNITKEFSNILTKKVQDKNERELKIEISDETMPVQKTISSQAGETEDENKSSLLMSEHDSVASSWLISLCKEGLEAAKSVKSHN